MGFRERLGLFRTKGTEGTTQLPVEFNAPKCDEQHEWSFNQNGKSNDRTEKELRRAFRHMVSVQHEINGETFGGLPLNDSISENLSLSFFQKVGLLKPVTTRFRGDIESIVDFAQLRSGDPECFHHWQIETPHGATSEGTCKHCGSVRNFNNSRPDRHWEDDSKKFFTPSHPRVANEVT